MARKKNSDAGGALLIILLCIAAILILSPLVIIFYGIYTSFKINKYQPKPKSISDFWLDPSEKQQFKTTLHNLLIINNKIDEAHLMAAEHNISINKDGSYSKRSNKGKEICAIIDKYTPMKIISEQEIISLQQQPYRSWESYTDLLSQLKSCYISMTSWIIGFIVICYYYQLDSFMTFKNYVTFNSSHHMIFIISGVISIVVFFICNILIKHRIIIPPKPPIVSIENLDDY